jgi:hypothetical protein
MDGGDAHARAAITYLSARSATGPTISWTAQRGMT